MVRLALGLALWLVLWLVWCQGQSKVGIMIIIRVRVSLWLGLYIYS